MSSSTAHQSHAGPELRIPPERLPHHIAIIMDGNGRWAQRHGLPRIEGHRRGVETVRLTVEECRRIGIGQLTLYCFSSENWKRPKRELDFLMRLLEQYLVEERTEITAQNIRFTTIGRQEGLPDRVLAELNKTVQISASNTGMILCLAVNYGGRAELVDAVQSLAEEVRAGRLQPNEITEQHLSQHLYTRDMSDPDLLIRTAGEQRISNFLLWQISYAELWVTPKCWPEFRLPDLYAALGDFAHRDRRFGGLGG